MSAFYPPDIIELLKSKWATPREFGTTLRPPLPTDKRLTELLSICYQASLLKEEGRRVQFRVIIFSREQLDLKDEAEKFLQFGNRVVLFQEPREFSVAELRRLAPAAESIRSLICVTQSLKGDWLTWGLLDTGSNWWKFNRHEVSGGQPPPAGLTISSHGPGELILSEGADVFFSLRTGQIYSTSSNLLFDGHISEFFANAKDLLHKETIQNLKITEWDSEGEDNDYPSRFYSFCISRILFNMRDKGHGGTLIVVRDEITHDDPRLTDRAIVKYESNYDHAWNLMLRVLCLHWRYYDLYFRLWDSKKSISRHEYREIHFIRQEQDEVTEQLSECLRFLASLSSVDGAVVITDRLRLIGFGAEIIALSPTLSWVTLAGDGNGNKARNIPIENYGTRHRSAFRFCSSFENSVVFIVSQDGGIKATKRHKKDVLMWADVGLGWGGM
jgi:hypothetical protein